MYSIIYSPSIGDDPGVIRQILKGHIDSKSWRANEEITYMNVADRTELETEAANIDPDWASKVDVRYYVQNEG